MLQNFNLEIFYRKGIEELVVVFKVIKNIAIFAANFFTIVSNYFIYLFQFFLMYACVIPILAEYS